MASGILASGTLPSICSISISNSNIGWSIASFTNQQYSMAWDGGSNYMTCSSTGAIYFSSNGGISFTTTYSSSMTSCRCIRFINNKFYLFYTNGTTDSVDIFTSTGVRTTYNLTIGGNGTYRIFYINGLFFAFPISGASNYYTSTDVITWISNNFTFYSPVTHLSYANSKYYIYSTYSETCQISSTGTSNWTNYSYSITAGSNYLIYSKELAPSGGSIVKCSYDDGVTWIPCNLTTNGFIINECIFTGSYYLLQSSSSPVVTFDGVIHYSMNNANTYTNLLTPKYIINAELYTVTFTPYNIISGLYTCPPNKTATIRVEIPKLDNNTNQTSVVVFNSCILWLGTPIINANYININTHNTFILSHGDIISLCNIYQSQNININYIITGYEE